MMRVTLSPTKRLAIFLAHSGECHICGCTIQAEHGELWELEHLIPLAMGGHDSADNLAPAHVACHRTKTRQDVGNVARAKRRQHRHLGIKKSRTPMQGWRRFDGTPVRNPKLERINPHVRETYEASGIPQARPSCGEQRAMELSPQRRKTDSKA